MFFRPYEMTWQVYELPISGTTTPMTIPQICHKTTIFIAYANLRSPAKGLTLSGYIWNPTKIKRGCLGIRDFKYLPSNLYEKNDNFLKNTI